MESYRGALPLLKKLIPPPLSREGDKVLSCFGKGKGGGLPNKYLKGVSPINNLPESRVMEIWQRQLLGGMELASEGGEPVKIIYPGRINDDRGADFRDAVIATSRGLIKGDIEVHTKSSDWRAHCHHQDPVYNRVILHVVMWDDTEAATDLQNGEKVPLLVLGKYIKSPVGQSPDWAYPPAGLSVPCLEAAERVTPGVIAEFLDSAGKERFSAKAFKFQADLARMEAGQCLYQGIMSALGYSKNKLPFLELARRLPLQLLESMTQGEITGEECLAQQQALLLGTAGLLPSQRPHWQQENKSGDKWVDKLEKLWDSSRQTVAMSYDAWHLFKVRPNNFPVRRIAAMSYLLWCYREKGILNEVIDMIRETPVGKEYHRLERGLMVTSNGYWASHFDFGLGIRTRSRTLLGSRRAADIVVNVLLPFTFAWSQIGSQPALGRKVVDLYRRYPKLAVNAVEKHMMNQLGLSGSLVNSARRQQGLIHIYNTLCTQGRCNCCPLSHIQS